MSREHNADQSGGWRWIWAATIGSAIVLGLWMAGLGPHATADDYAQYLMHARALVEGREYRDIGYLFTHHAWGTGPPIAAPGLPLTLVPVLSTIGFHDWMHPVFMLACLLLLAWVSGRYFSRENRVHGACTAFLVTVALLLSGATRTLAPDLMFAMLIWTALLLADSAPRWGWGRTTLIVLAGAWAIMYRTAGIPLVPTAALFGLLFFRQLRWKPLLPIAAWGLTFWYLYFVMGAGQFPSAESSLGFTPDGASSNIVRRVIKNVTRYRWPLFEAQLYPTTWKLFNAGYHVLVTGIMAVGLVPWVRQNWNRFGTIFAAGYVAMLIIAPVQSGRYFWPLFPLVAYGIVHGLDRLLAVGRFADLTTAKRVMAPLLIATACATVATMRTPVEQSILDRESVLDVFSFFEVVGAEEPDTRAVFFKPRTFAWETGVPGMPLFLPPDEAEALRELREKQITHVIVGTLGLQDADAVAFWQGVVANRADVFSSVMSNDDFQVYRFGSTSLEPTSNAIDVIPR